MFTSQFLNNTNNSAKAPLCSNFLSLFDSNQQNSSASTINSSMSRSSSNNSHEVAPEQPFKSRFGFFLNEDDEDMGDSLASKLDSKVFNCFNRQEESCE